METWTPEDLKQHIEADKKILLKLWKKGCGICKLSVPATERMEASNPHGLTFGKISVDDYPEMLEIAGTDVLPAFFVFANKKNKGLHIGFKGLEKLETFVSEALAS